MKRVFEYVCARVNMGVRNTDECARELVGSKGFLGSAGSFFCGLNLSGLRKAKTDE
jgi:hypothetical protein